MNDLAIQRLINQQRLPDSFIEVVNDVYQPICTALALQFGEARSAPVIGINGCPGSGKSTMALFLKAILEERYELSVVVLSIDDFYKTKQQRLELANDVHPLLATRGVPGTHDVAMAQRLLFQLKEFNHELGCRIPRFDKASDDRLPKEHQDQIVHAPDLIILEGWCVAATPQSDVELEQPINTLEETKDAKGVWRAYVNQQLAKDYQSLFSQIDYLIVLQPPDANIVLKWRIQQEQKLRDKLRAKLLKQGGFDTGRMGMSDEQIAIFVMHYERLVRHMIKQLPPLANSLITLDENRQVIELSIRSQ